MQLNVKTLKGNEYKILLKQMQADAKNRGPSGEPKLSVSAAGIDGLVEGINKVAVEQNTNAVEVLDACLRALKLSYHLGSKERTKADDEAKEVTLG